MHWKTAAPGWSDLKEDREHRAMRNEQFLRHGIDRDGMTGFIVDSAGPLPEKVLDIGTGRGFTAIELARRGAAVTTVDTSEDMLRSAWLHAVDTGMEDRIEFHLANGGDLPFEEGSFGAVTMVNVLHHLENPEEVLPEIARVLMPGGRLIVADFTDRGFEILDRIHRESGNGDDMHTGETMDRFISRLDSVGMSCVSRDRRFHQHVIVAEKE